MEEMESIKKERRPFRWVSTVAYKTVDKIVSRGYNTTELVEKGYGLIDIIFVDFQSRIPLLNEKQMLDYLLLVNLEDGLTPNAAIARIVAKGDGYMTQCAGSSVLAFGPAYGGFCALGGYMEEYLEKMEKNNITLADAAKQMVSEYPLIKENQGRTTLGVSAVDLNNPTPGRIFDRAEKLNVAGKYIALMKEIVKAAQDTSETPIALDMLGATTAAMLDLQFTPEAAWSIIAVTRAFASGCHAIEEVEREPKEIWGAALSPIENYDGPEDRPVPVIEDRDKVAVANKKSQGETLESWYRDFQQKQKILGTGHAVVEEVPFLRKIRKD
jgi:citrate synthase